jgi:16S rRNA (cytosine967-C5)-methyltransferase
MLQVQVTAAQILAHVLSGKNLNATLDRAFAAAPGLLPQQRGAVREVCFDALRHLGFLRAQLRELMKHAARPAEIEALLLAALAQLQFGRARDYTIVDHAVRASGMLGAPQAKRLVNAVLRNWLRRKEYLCTHVLAQPEARYNLPSWWLDKITKQFPECWQELAASAQRHPPLTLRVNLRRTSVDAQKTKLIEAGFQVSRTGPLALEINPPRATAEIPGFTEGLVSVQDAGAQYAAPFLDAQDGMRVLDACAAPGGKSGHILERNNVELLALDSDAVRVSRIESNLQRLGLSARVVAADAGAPDIWWDGKPFERILLDVPCSGSGVIRRHPDIKWLRRPDDMAQYAKNQLRLLGVLWNCLSKDGRLLYATCSIFREENAVVVDAFVAQLREAGKPVNRIMLPAVFQEDGCTQPRIINGQLLPDDHHDGFYFALLENG